MKRLISLATLTVAALGLLAGFSGAAAADTISPNPITFEAGQGYTVNDINGQQGWMKTGSYDAAVANVASFPAAAGYGFGAQALRLSDAVTSSSFGDQTFSPGLAQPAGEGLAQTHFEASFQIGTTSASVQPGSHMSVSPDNGSGGRMSYLRFADQGDGVHVYFDDVTDTGAYYTLATFNETDIATLSRTSAHTVVFDIAFKTNAADVVNIYIDGALKAHGTTWENYYRFDNEGNGPGAVPITNSLLFRESGANDPGNAGGGFLVDGVSLTSSASSICLPTGFFRDGINLTAAQIGGTVTGPLDATGCNIGAYNPTSVSNAHIFGANYFGVLDNGVATNVTGSHIDNIGEVPLNGSQHGNAVVYLGGASGIISGNTVSKYQKNGITVSGIGTSATVTNNTVTGEGHINYIAQNGIQISFGGTATVTGNTVSGNWYTPATVTACGLLFFQATGVKQSKNNLFDNQMNLCNFGRGGGNTSAG
jgi:hypothetical protein